MTAWMRMTSGSYVDLETFSEKDVDFVDVQLALSRIKRCNGHGALREPLSVMQHSFLVHYLACMEGVTDKRLLLACLLHDAHEYVIGDFTSPMKELTGYVEPEHIVTAVRNALGTSDGACSLIKRWDLLALEVERLAQYGDDPHEDRYWPERMTHWSNRKATHLFDSMAQVTVKQFTDLVHANGGIIT